MDSEAFYYQQQFQNSPGKQPQYYGDPSTPVYDISKIQHQEASPTDSESRQSQHYAGWATVVQHTENSVSPRFSEYDYMKRSSILSTDSANIFHYKHQQQRNMQQIKHQQQQQNYNNFLNTINSSDISNNYHQYDKNSSSCGAGIINSNSNIRKNDVDSNNSNNTNNNNNNSNNSDSLNNHNAVSHHNSQHNNQLLQQLQHQQQPHHQQHHHPSHHPRCRIHQGQF